MWGEDRVFYFRVNNVPIFAKGANFIPIDLFENRVTSEDRDYIIKTAMNSNYNMIRVWGGGVYQPTEFYDACDRNGLMIWQEFMFACATYPRDQNFLHEVALEVQETALRLASHPSIFVFGGNNENEVGLEWYQESRDNRDLYVADYVKLYGDTVFGTLQKVLGTNFYQSENLWVDSSPSNGLLSVEPYVKRWTRASTEAAGDMHFYDYSMDCELDGNFPKARFASEYGF
jgi:beta-mannosidase